MAHPELGPKVLLCCASYVMVSALKRLLLSRKAIILDAELTLHTPEKLWLSTGMRAVDHAVETQYR